jgi:hypothetical protein
VSRPRTPSTTVGTETASASYAFLRLSTTDLREDDTGEGGERATKRGRFRNSTRPAPLFVGGGRAGLKAEASLP